MRGYPPENARSAPLPPAAGQEMLCCALGRGANTVAAGSEAAVLFWDRRTRRPQAAFTDSFAEAVTQARVRCLQQPLGLQDAGSPAPDTRPRCLLCNRQSNHPPYSAQVHFYPGNDHLLLAGDVDGMCAVFDTQKGFAEEDGFRACLNIGTSVAQMGLFGPQQEKLWVRSTTESLHLWLWGAALTEEGLEGAGECRLEGAREAAQAALQVGRGDRG